MAAIVGATLAASCTPAMRRLPPGPWASDAGVSDIFDAAARSCRGIRTFSAEVSVTGRSAGSKLRGRLLAGFERPGRVRLEGVAPFGAPLFVLAARDNRAVLLLPRDRRVLVGESVGDVLEALTGLKRDADDLLALLGGCVVSGPVPGAGARHPSGWLSMVVGAGLSVYLHRDGPDWRIAAGRQERTGVGAPEWFVEYGEFSSGFPAFIRLRESARADARPDLATDLTLRVSQRDVNVAVSDAAFGVAVPADAVPMSLAELRGRGPLAEAGAPPRRHP